MCLYYALRARYQYSEFFWSVFSRIRTKNGKIRRYSAQMRGNTGQKNSETSTFRAIKI